MKSSRRSPTQPSTGPAWPDGGGTASGTRRLSTGTALRDGRLRRRRCRGLFQHETRITTSPLPAQCRRSFSSSTWRDLLQFVWCTDHQHERGLGHAHIRGGPGDVRQFQFLRRRHDNQRWNAGRRGEFCPGQRRGDRELPGRAGLHQSPPSIAALGGGGSVVLGAPAQSTNLTVTGGGAFSGGISQVASSTASLTMAGTGSMLALSGTNAYTGGTTITRRHLICRPGRNWFRPYYAQRRRARPPRRPRHTPTRSTSRLHRYWPARVGEFRRRPFLSTAP